MKTPLPPEFDAMAQRFIELWQEQWMSFANNKDTAAAMQKLTELMVPPGNLTSYLKSGGPHESQATGATPAPSPFEFIAQQLAQLTGRVDALHQRVEAAVPAKRKPAAKPRAAKPRAKPAAAQRAKPKPARASTRKSNKRKPK